MAAEQESSASDEPALHKPATVLDTSVADDTPPDFLPGIDIDDGMKRMRGKWSSYKRLLMLFYKEYKTSADKMASLLAEGSFEDVELMAHSFKGVSGTLGAWQFYEEAKLMEAACRVADEEVAVAQLVTFRRCLEEIIDGLAVLR